MHKNYQRMWIVAVGLLVALGHVASPHSAAAQGRIAPLIWEDKIADDAKQKVAPDRAFIADEGTWKVVWKAWREGKPPKIDFERYIVLVGTCPGPNRVTISIKNGKVGDLKVTSFGTEIAGPGFGYKMIRWNRGRIKTINGKPIKVRKADL